MSPLKLHFFDKRILTEILVAIFVGVSGIIRIGRFVRDLRVVSYRPVVTKVFLCFRVIRHGNGVPAVGYFHESGSEFSIFGTKGTSFLGETTDLWLLQIDVALILEAIKRHETKLPRAG